jgi:hypothetical protein
VPTLTATLSDLEGISSVRDQQTIISRPGARDARAGISLPTLRAGLAAKRRTILGSGVRKLRKWEARLTH